MAIANLRTRLLAAAATVICGSQAVFGADLYMAGPDFWGLVEGGNLYGITAKGEGKGFEVRASLHANFASAKSPPDRHGAAAVMIWLSDQYGMYCPDGGKPKIVMASERKTDEGWIWEMSPDCRLGSR